VLDVDDGTIADVESKLGLEEGKERREREKVFGSFEGEMGRGEDTCTGGTSSIFLWASHAGRNE